MKKELAILAGIAAIVGLFLILRKMEGASMTLPNPTPPSPPDFGGGFSSESIQAISAAIARAEGFGVSGAIPTRAHNPGDVVEGDKGYGTLGTEHITVFSDDSTGWQALYHLVNRILSDEVSSYRDAFGLSSNLDMTFYQLAQKYTGNDSPDTWANNVASILGVSADVTLRQYLGG